MKRILAFVLVVLIMVGTLWGCQASDSQPTETEGSGELTQAQEDKILEALVDSFVNDELQVDYPLAWYHEYDFGAVYLGYENGYDIFYYNPGYLSTGMADIDPPNLVLGEVNFNAMWLTFLAYKNGKIYYLQNLYDDGKISQEKAQELKTAYDAYLEDMSYEKVQAGRIRYIRENGNFLGQVDDWEVWYCDHRYPDKDYDDFVLEDVTFEDALRSEFYAYKEGNVEISDFASAYSKRTFTQEDLLALRDAYLACRDKNAD